MTSGWGKALAIGLSAGFLAAGSYALAQVAEEEEEDTGGLRFTGTVALGFEASDNINLQRNPSGTDTRTFADLLFGVSIERPLSEFSLEFGGTAQLENYSSAREENGFEDPFARLEYRLRGRDTRFSFSAGYSQDDIVDTLGLDLDGDLITDTFLSSIGDVERSRARASLDLGLNAPVGANVLISRRDTNYSNTISPDLFDRTTDIARVAAVVRPSQVLEFGVYVEREEYEAEDVDQTIRKIDDVGITVDYDINPILSFEGSIADVDVEETTTSGISNSGGTGFDLALVRDMPNGSLTFFAEREFGDLVSRTSYGVSRLMEMPSALVDATIGVSESDTGDTVVYFGLDYIREFPTGTLITELNQDAIINSDDEEVLQTTLDVDYIYDLTPSSSVSFGLLFLKTDDIGSGSVSEGTRTDLEVIYSREVTRDWDWQVGYRNRRTDPESGASARSNSIFTTFARSFSLRP